MCHLICFDYRRHFFFFFDTNYLRASSCLFLNLCWSHPLRLSRFAPSQPQECISRNAWRDELDQTSSEQRWSPAVSCSLTSLRLLSTGLLPLRSASSSSCLLLHVFFPSPPPPGLPLSSLLSCKAICCSFSTLCFLFSPPCLSSFSSIPLARKRDKEIF